MEAVEITCSKCDEQFFLPTEVGEEDKRIIYCPYCLSKRLNGTDIVKVIKDQQIGGERDASRT